MADNQAPTEARLEAERILKNASPAVQDQLRELLTPSSPGRPKGTGYDDTTALAFAANLIGSRVSRSSAIAQAARKFPVHSSAADKRRLSSKLDAYLKATEKTPEELLRAARRAEVLKRAFEEDVGWDI